MDKIIIGLIISALVTGGCKSNEPEKGRDLIAATRHINPNPQPIQNFSELNPNYKDRAGVFYDIEYVSPSAKSLIKIADIKPNQMRETMKILRLFVDEWLDVYVDNNAIVTRDQAGKCVQSMNNRFEDLLDPLQYKQYCIWRDDNSGEYNRLRFLMNRPSMERTEERHTQHGDLRKQYDPPQALEAMSNFRKTQQEKILTANATLSPVPTKIEPSRELLSLAEEITNEFDSIGDIGGTPPQTLEEAKTLLFEKLAMPRTRIPIRWFEVNDIYYFYGFVDINTNQPNDDFSSGLAMRKGRTTVYQWSAESLK